MVSINGAWRSLFLVKFVAGLPVLQGVRPRQFSRIVPMINPCLHTVILYVRDPEASAAFFTAHFALHIAARDGGMIELCGSAGAGLLLHPAAKSARLGQAGVKLSFAVEDVATFVAQAAERGLSFGPIHAADGYEFANARDPDGHQVSVSSRFYRRLPQRLVK